MSSAEIQNQAPIESTENTPFASWRCVYEVAFVLGLLLAFTALVYLGWELLLRLVVSTVQQRRPEHH
jgi:hypothetical protein